MHTNFQNKAMLIYFHYHGNKSKSKEKKREKIVHVYCVVTFLIVICCTERPQTVEMCKSKIVAAKYKHQQQ